MPMKRVEKSSEDENGSAGDVDKGTENKMGNNQNQNDEHGKEKSEL